MQRKKLLILVSPIAILVLWQIASLLNIVNPLFLPTPYETALKLVELLASAEAGVTIWPDIFATLYRMLVSFALAAIIGIPLGLVMGYSDKIYYSLEFFVDFFRSLPATAMFPLFMLFFGIGDESKIAVTAFACALIIVVNTMYGVHHASKLRIMAAKIMKAGTTKLFTKVIFPDALPGTFAGMRIAVSLALIIIIVTEMFIGTNFGLGRRIIDAQLVYRIPEMYAAIIIAGVLGFIVNTAFVLIEKRIVHWTGK